jgi:hypothetical protein
VRQYGRTVMTGVALVGAVALLAGCEARQMPEPDVATHPGQQPDPAAQGRVVSLTGCLMPGDTPGEYTLASVATAGVLPGTGEPQQDGRAYTVDRAPASEADQAALVADTSYRVIPMDDVGDDLHEHLNRRVTLVGRVAAEAPQHGAAAGPEGAGIGQAGADAQVETQQDAAQQQQAQQRAAPQGTAQPGATGTAGQQPPTETTVVAEPPPLRGFYAQSVRRVADTCVAPGGN